MYQWIVFNVEVPHIGTIIIRVGNIALTTSWNTSYTTPHTPQVQRSSLDEKMVELERLHAELVLENAEFRRSRAEMDYSQVGLSRFLDQNEISQPPNGRMTKLEATMTELERVHARYAISQVQFMELTRANGQIQPTPFKSVKRRDGSNGHFLYSTCI